MWFPLGFQNFIAKKNFKDDSCDIYVSDFIRIWHISLSNNELFTIFKTLNPLLEASVQKLRDIAFKLLEDVKVKKEVIEENKNVLLKLESNIMQVKFQFQVLLKPGNGEMLYNELTLPLLLLLINTQNREKKLINIIKDKDAEIKNYREEYGVRGDFLATEPFSEKKFASQEPERNIFWDSTLLLDCISTKLPSNETVHNIKEQDQLIKDEPEIKHCVDKDAMKKLVFKKKNFNQREGSKPCLLLDNKIIKKKKKINEGFTIKF